MQNIESMKMGHFTFTMAAENCKNEQLTPGTSGRHFACCGAVGIVIAKRLFKKITSPFLRCNNILS